MIKTLYKPFQNWSEGGSVWIISDTHFDDPDNKYMNPEWPDAEATAAIINRTVGRNDTLVCLGDVGDPKYMRRIRCKHKVLLTGNHDAGASKYADYFDEIYTGPLLIGDRLLLSHEPAYVPWAFNIHGHTHCRKNPLEFDSDGGLIALNVCSDVIGWTPVNLGQLIKNGLLADIRHIHRITIDNATENGALNEN